MFEITQEVYKSTQQSRYFRSEAQIRTCPFLMFLLKHQENLIYNDYFNWKISGKLRLLVEIRTIITIFRLAGYNGAREKSKVNLESTW